MNWLKGKRESDYKHRMRWTMTLKMQHVLKDMSTFLGHLSKLR